MAGDKKKGKKRRNRNRIARGAANPPVADGRIVPIATNNPDRITSLSFKFYNQRTCGLSGISKADAKKLTSKLKAISGVNYSDLKAKDKIEKGGNYANLYSDLPKYATVQEILFTGAGRIFYWLENPLVHVISIERSHR